MSPQEVIYSYKDFEYRIFDEDDGDSNKMIHEIWKNGRYLNIIEHSPYKVLPKEKFDKEVESLVK